METLTRSDAYSGNTCGVGLLRSAAVGGLAAGFGIAAYESLVSLALYDDFLLPGRMAASMLLGPEALNRWYSPFTAALIGLGIHVLLSLLFGIIFGLLVRRSEWRASASRFIAAGALYGTVLWFLNFYLIAPVFAWLWFTLQTAPLLQGLIGHALFGAILGWTVAHRCRSTRTAFSR